MRGFPLKIQIETLKSRRTSNHQRQRQEAEARGKRQRQRSPHPVRITHLNLKWKWECKKTSFVCGYNNKKKKRRERWKNDTIKSGKIRNKRREEAIKKPAECAWKDLKKRTEWASEWVRKTSWKAAPLCCDLNVYQLCWSHDIWLTRSLPLTCCATHSIALSLSTLFGIFQTAAFAWQLSLVFASRLAI